MGKPRFARVPEHDGAAGAQGQQGTPRLAGQYLGRTAKVRLNLEVSPEVNDKLEELAQRIGGTKGDVLRGAITLIEVAVTAREQGKKFGVVEQNQPLVTEIVGI